MSNPSSEPNNPQNAWQSQPTEGVRMSIAEVQARASAFQTKISRRNLREYAAAAIVVLFFGYRFAYTADPFIRGGMALIIAGTCYVVWQLHIRGAAREIPKEAGLSSFIDFQRQQLIRQRDMLTNLWSWYLGPLLPGMVVLMVAVGHATAGRVPHAWLLTVIYLGIVTAVFGAIDRLNKRAARRLQRQIDELDAASR
jgi:Flp pilus assembly protein TadB